VASRTVRQQRPLLPVPSRIQFAPVRGTLAGSKQLQEGIGAAVRQAALSPGAPLSRTGASPCSLSRLALAPAEVYSSARLESTRLYRGGGGLGMLNGALHKVHFPTYCCAITWIL
jgi:hypothetical protein